MNRVADYAMTNQERQNLSQLTVDYSEVPALSDIWEIAAQRFGEVVALHAPHAKPEVKLTYRQLNEAIKQVAAGLQALGVNSGDRIAFFSDNSPRWLIADQGMMLIGAVNAVRSSQADIAELHFLTSDSGAIALVLEDAATFKKLRDRLDGLPLQFAVLLSDEAPPEDTSLKVLNFSQLIEAGMQHTLRSASLTRADLATLIYTSGTTGKPKGAMLTHGNLMHQVTTFGSILQPQPGDRILSILPTWHAYERSVEYFMLSQGCTQVYTSIRTMKKDLAKYKPHYMVSVPRVWESIYEGIQKQFKEQPKNRQQLITFCLGISQRYIAARRIVAGLDLLNPQPALVERTKAATLVAALYPIHALGEKIVYNKVRTAATGGEFRYAISGGGSLAKHLDDFFEIVKINVLVGYGLTETSPVTNVRRPWRNLRGSSGQPILATEIKIVDAETRQVMPQGQRGLVFIRGPQIMRGYYQNPESTKKAIDAAGWFDSGDIGWVTQENDLVLTGRAKDTIVLTNGENIEPQPIEDACLRSPFISQIMLVGQDQRSLGALIVPNLETLADWAAAKGFQLELPPGDGGIRSEAVKPESGAVSLLALESKEIQDLYRQELNREVQNRPGYRADDRVGSIRLLLEPFSVENGLLTQTLKVRRNIVMDRYQGMINEMFA